MKKKKNLAELENRLIDKLEDKAKVLTNQLAGMFETSKKFRLVENRMQCLMEIIVMVSTPATESNIKKIFANLVKDSKKLKNPSVLLLHLKSQIALIKKLDEGY